MRFHFHNGWIIVRAAGYELLMRWWFPAYALAALALLRIAIRGDWWA